MLIITGTHSMNEIVEINNVIQFTLTHMST
jgi:hypothetical protein